MEFQVLRNSKKSRARLGILSTPHGEVLTPTLVGVATNATIKALRSDEVLATKTQLLIANTYHLHIAPGEKVVKSAGGLHKFMKWPRPIMTDSGGFQVFSLGFGRDFGVGKVNPKKQGSRETGKGQREVLLAGKIERAIEKGTQPQSVRIDDDGVNFRSPFTGQELFLGPKESIAIQEKLGADIMFAFDECTPPKVTREYMKTSLERTHRWEKMSLEARRSKTQALYGIVQGSQFKDLRQASARYINRLKAGGAMFDGFGIGGDLGESKTGTKQILDWTLPLLDPKRPRHLLGIGHIEDIEIIVKAGVDTFDCTVPTHYARRGIAFTSGGRVDFNKVGLLRDKNPIDPKCDCLVCVGYRRNYIAHLIRAKEITGGAMLTFHNLYFFNTYIEAVREKIRRRLL